MSYVSTKKIINIKVMSEGKRYGLILSKKTSKANLLTNKPSIFGDDSDEEIPTVAKQSRPKPPATKLKKQTQIEIEQALAEDPTVYEYDEIYDDIKGTKKSQEKTTQKKIDKKSKYIDNLIKFAAQRKKTYERQVEKKVQKERQAEEGMFDDKEAFVTSAYKKKMQEMQEEEEKERKKAELEDMLDVRKQKDLSGFYRHIYAQTTGEDPDVAASKDENKQDHKRSSTDQIKVEDFPEDKDLSMSESSDSDSSSSSDSQKHRSTRKKSGRDKRGSGNDITHEDGGGRSEAAESRNRDSSPIRKYHDKNRGKHTRNDSDRDKERKSTKYDHNERMSDRERHDNRYNKDKDRHRYSERHDDKTRETRHRDDRHKDDRYRKDKHRHQSNHGDESENKGQKVDKPHDRDDYQKKSTAMVAKSQDSRRTAEDRPTSAITSNDTGEHVSKCNKRTVGDNLDDAKARYLARKKARPSVIVHDDD